MKRFASLDEALAHLFIWVALMFVGSVLVLVLRLASVLPERPTIGFTAGFLAATALMTLAWTEFHRRRT